MGCQIFMFAVIKCVNNKEHPLNFQNNTNFKIKHLINDGLAVQPYCTNTCRISGMHILNDYLPVKNMWLPKWRGAESMCCADTTNVIFHDGFLLFWKAINF